MSSFLSSHTGELFAITVAFLWAVSSILYSRIGKVIPPLELNFLKGVLALAFVIATLLITGQIIKTINPTAVILLLLSGVFGIGIGDTAYLDALRSIGPRRATLIKITAPPFAGLISWVFLGEKLSVFSWIGIGIILFSIAWVIAERTKDTTPAPQVTKKISRGAIMALIAAICEALGVVLSHAALTRTAVSPMWSTFFRLFAGIVTASILLIIKRQSIGGWLKRQDRNRTGLLVITVVFFGTFLGIFLQQLSLQRIPAGITQTLIATSPIFVLPISALLGEKISIRAVLGALLAIIGVALIFVPPI